MSEIMNFFKNNPGVASAIASTVPATIGAFQANSAKNAQQDYLKELETAEKNRQQIINPYASMSNPMENLQVATKAAEMQAEQSDLALANTLDALRQTGAGGATALAQAALKSKQGIASTIEQQEVQNARLAAQGEQRVQQLQAQGEQFAFATQEQRELQRLDRLQSMADIEAERRAGGQAAMYGALGDIAGSLISGAIKPGE